MSINYLNNINDFKQINKFIFFILSILSFIFILSIFNLILICNQAFAAIDNQLDDIINKQVKLFNQNTNIINLSSPYNEDFKDIEDINRIFKSLDNSRNHFNHALILAKNGSNTDAIKYLNLAISLDPKYVDAYIARAEIYEKQGNLNAALIDYSSALNLRPSDQIFYNRGLIKFILKRFNEAMVDFNYAIELNPLFAKAYYERGIVLLELNMLIPAKHNFIQAFKLNSKLISALEKVGDLNLIQKDYVNALQNYNQLVILKPKDPDLYFKRGNTYEFLGNYEKSFNDYQKAVDLYSDYINNSNANYQNNNFSQTEINDYEDYSDEIQDDKSVIYNFS